MEVDDLPYTTVLQTSRLTLRLANTSVDADCLQIIVIYEGAMVALGRDPYGPGGLNSIAAVRKRYATHGPRQNLCPNHVPTGNTFFIHVKDTNEVVGFITCVFRPEMPFPDLGYTVLQPFWGRGYASEAGREVVKWWREVIGVKEMWAAITETNERSQKTAERIGFVRGGGVDFVLGEKVMRGVAYVLPGMEWSEVDDEGNRMVVRAPE